MVPSLSNWSRNGRSVDPRDEGGLPDLTSGLMWLATGIGGLTVLALPGTPRSHLTWMIGLAVFAVVWGVISVGLGISSRAMPVGHRALVTAATLPLVGVALWATGGAASFLQPVLLFTALFIAYFFPARFAWPLSVLFVVTYASPLLYDGHAVEQGYPARAAMFAIAVMGQTLAMRFLKNGLLRAEALQRRMAELDPLTGLANRRAFDAALTDALERCRAAGHRPTFRGVGLVVFDFDGFKAINDAHGHPTGDAVLRAVAEACRGVVREGDCLARIGGDEFAVVALGAGTLAVRRLVDALADAIATADLPAGVPAVRAAFGSASAPQDSSDAAELLRRADHRLLGQKRRAHHVRPARARPRRDPIPART
jgi:diguanylate cyclase (GGDEF)-like protein